MSSQLPSSTSPSSSRSGPNDPDREGHRLVIVFTLFDALVANKYFHLFSLDYLIETPKAIRFGASYDNLESTQDLADSNELPDWLKSNNVEDSQLPDLILINDLERLPKTLIRFIHKYKEWLSQVFIITHTGGSKRLQARSIHQIKDTLGDRMHPHPLSQHSSCGFLVERIVEMGHGSQTHDLHRYHKALHSIWSEFVAI